MIKNKVSQVHSINISNIIKVVECFGGYTSLYVDEGRYIVSITNNPVGIEKLPFVITEYEEAKKPYGVWLNNGTYYVDINTTTDNLQQALELAKQYNQLAVWDRLECKEIVII